MSAPIHKLVCGRRIRLTQEEIDNIQAYWDANNFERVARKQKIIDDTALKQSALDKIAIISQLSLEESQIINEVFL